MDERGRRTQANHWTTSWTAASNFSTENGGGN